MLITREMDYCVRIVRALNAVPQRPAPEIAAAEHMQPAVTYKMLKQLTKAGILVSRRGVAGGYALRHSTEEITLYDVFCAVNTAPQLTECLAPGYQCPNNADDCCRVHREFGRIQSTLETELKRYTLAEIFSGAAENERYALL